MLLSLKQVFKVSGHLNIKMLFDYFISKQEHLEKSCVVQNINESKSWIRVRPARRHVFKNNALPCNDSCLSYVFLNYTRLP